MSTISYISTDNTTVSSSYDNSYLYKTDPFYKPILDEKLKPKPKEVLTLKKVPSLVAQIYNNIFLYMGQRLKLHIIETKMSICMPNQTYAQDYNLNSSINNTRGVAAIYFYDRLLSGYAFPNQSTRSVLFMEMLEEFLDANIFRMFFCCKANLFIVSMTYGLLKKCQKSMIEAGLKILGTAQIDRSEKYETFLMVCKWAI
jgi:hypothetical protein